jgi:pimeloyl-ACP methyl ester carboxylesterase
MITLIQTTHTKALQIHRWWRKVWRWVVRSAGFMALQLVIMALIGFAYEMISSWQERKAFPPPGEMVNVGGGRLHLLSEGKGTPTVVLDTGLGSSSLYWGKVMPLITPQTRVCVFDRAGYGWSDPGIPPRTTQQIAKELHTLLQNARLPTPYILVGWSFGGFTARMYAHLYPQEIAGIVLVESAHEEQFERYMPIVVDGIKKTGLNLEPLMSALGGPEHTHSLIETTVSRFHLLKSMTGWTRWQRRNETGGDFWNGYPGGTWEKIRFSELQHGYLQAVLGEQKAWEESIAQIRQVRDLGNLPLTVVSRRQELKGPFPKWFPAEEIERHWQVMQSDLLRLSTQSKQVFASPSDHLVPHWQPQVVADSVLQQVRDTRRSLKNWEAEPKYTALSPRHR